MIADHLNRGPKMQDPEAGMSLGQDTGRPPELHEGEREDCDVKSGRMAG